MRGGVDARTSTRHGCLGGGGYNTHSTLPMRAAYTPRPPRRLQPTGIIKLARVLRGSRKNISPFASSLCFAAPPPSALHPTEPPALLIAKNHFSSVQLSSGFSSCVFSFSIFLYFLFALCRNVFRAQAARAVQAAASLRASVSAVNSLNQKINKLNKHRAEAGTSSLPPPPLPESASLLLPLPRFSLSLCLSSSAVVSLCCTAQNAGASCASCGSCCLQNAKNATMPGNKAPSRPRPFDGTVLHKGPRFILSSADYIRLHALNVQWGNGLLQVFV